MNNKYVYLYVKNIFLFKKIFTTKERRKEIHFLARIFFLIGGYIAVATLLPFIVIRLSEAPNINLNYNLEILISGVLIHYLICAVLLLFALILVFVPLIIFNFESAYGFSLDEPEQSLFYYIKKDTEIMKAFVKMSNDNSSDLFFSTPSSVVRLERSKNYLILDNPDPYTSISSTSNPLIDLFKSLIYKASVLLDYHYELEQYVKEKLPLSSSQQASVLYGLKQIILELKNISTYGLTIPQYSHYELNSITESFSDAKIKEKIKEIIHCQKTSILSYSKNYKRFKNEIRRRILFIQLARKISVMILLVYLSFWGLDFALRSLFGEYSEAITSMTTFLEFSWFIQMPWWQQATTTISLVFFSVVIPISILLLYCILGFTSNYFLAPAVFAYSESLCFWQLLLLNFDLQQDQLFNIPEALNLCERRINYIEVLCSRIPNQYSYSSKSELVWARTHFNNISEYLSERQRWLRSPIASTHQTLKNDCLELLEIFASRQYGNFKWSKENMVTKDNDTKSSKQIYIKSGILLSSVTCLIAIHQFWQEHPDFYSYILVSLILYLIDDLCELEILDNVLKVTKDIINLTK